MEMMTTLLLVLLGVETAALVAVIILYRKARKAAKTRTVEAPNSAYKSRYVEDLEAQERWENMDLDRLHEVNREEVVKLLEKVRSTSTRTLTTSERAFMDRMAEAHDRVVPPENRTTRKRKRPPQTPHRLPGMS
jgi:hypothetical protein